ncbi:HNH endonuclease family protein [Streptomyces sp. NPDC094049]|uniref:HNH endonuclease family protein n=1 Tax=Streptomyces sp. NPDC094049 TaxID=3154987 RepID=UPI0033227193
MITTLRRAAVAAVLTVLPLTMTAPVQAASPVRAAVLGESAPLGVAVGLLPVSDESREGYTRTKFRHWNAGADLTDGCDTRREVLIAEAMAAPAVGARCALTGGEWSSYYDEQHVVGASGLDIDHMVPLAEAWDSGASVWTAARREAYANDQGAPASLVAVTARSNRSKADKDPGEWLPPAASALCRYAVEWTSTKLRWGLAVDEEEQRRLFQLAAGCGDETVSWTPAP